MPTRFEAMDALEALRDDAFDAEQGGAFGGPIARTAGAVFLAGEDDQRRVVLRIFHGGVVDAHDFAARLVFGDAAFGAGGHQVLDADVGKGAAGHDAVVAAARAVAVEVLESDAVIQQIFSGGRGLS